MRGSAHSPPSRADTQGAQLHERVARAAAVFGECDLAQGGALAFVSASIVFGFVGLWSTIRRTGLGPRGGNPACVL